MEQQVLIAWIMGFSVLGSIGAIAGAALLLAFHDVTRKKLVPYQVSFASGTLLCVARLAR